MAKQIALNLTINGVKQNIKSINDLEKAISGAQKELKTLEVGSDEFNKLSKEINNAKNQFIELKNSFKGTEEIQQRLTTFAKVGEGITASFAAAQAAIALFGNESEDVARAAAKAQSVLTLAIAARSVAEGVLKVRVIATNIATLASAAAAKSATTATRLLYTTLAANPYGAILAVIGLVVAALATLTKETKKQINVQKELISVQSQEADNLKGQLRILTQYTNLKRMK